MDSARQAVRLLAAAGRKGALLGNGKAGLAALEAFRGSLAFGIPPLGRLGFLAAGRGFNVAYGIATVYQSQAEGDNEEKPA
jgi:hypothetical protein